MKSDTEKMARGMGVCCSDPLAARWQHGTDWVFFFPPFEIGD